METERKEPDVQGIERLVLGMARTFNWISLYQAGHPSLAGRVEDLHRDLVAQITRERSGRLLLGIAKDKVLYQNEFLGNGHHLVRNFTEELFLRQIATLDFSREVTPQELLSFFLCLQRLRAEKGEEKMEELLKREGVRGISLYPYNYKEVLSRRIIDAAEGEPSPNREDDLWRMILTENASSGDGDLKISDQVSIPPELIPAILRRAKAASANPASGPATPADTALDAVSPETVQRILTRLGEMLRGLPWDRRREVLGFLDAGIEEIGGAENVAVSPVADAFVRSMTDGHSDDEFLDLLAALLAAEEKGGKRLRRIFEVIAADRNGNGSLLPRVQEHLRESLRSKNYYAQRVWETVEQLLLGRTEKSYIGQEHSRLLETLSGTDVLPSAAGEKRVAPDPAFLADFDERSLHRKATSVLLELLAEEESEGDFLELLEEVRKVVPNLISRSEFRLLRSVLSTLTSVDRNAPESRKPAIRRVIGEVDFAHMMDLYLASGLTPEDREHIEDMIVSFLDASINDFLDRLLMEPEQSNRRVLLSLAGRFGGEAFPAIRERLGDPRWFFLRNLCLILGKIGPPDAIPELIRLLHHEDSRVRREAIQALGKLRAQESIPFLGKILLHESLLPSAREDSLRIDAANALFLCGGAKGADFLRRGAECRRKKVREHCTALLGTLEAR
jgi:hypothetical protein